MVPMRADLLALFETDELKKYLTGEELPADAAAEPASPEASAAEPEASAAENEEDDR